MNNIGRFAFLLALIALSLCAHPEAKLEFTDYCKYYKYPV